MKKKALVVANTGGFASFLLSDIDTLLKMGYSITYAANGKGFDWKDTKENLNKRNVRFVQIDFDNIVPYSQNNSSWIMQNALAFGQMRRLIAEESFDLIHCHTPIAGLITRICAVGLKQKKTKVIYTTHGFSFTSHSSAKSRFVYKTAEYFGSLLCDAIVTINLEDYGAAKKMACKQVFYVHGVGVNTQVYENIQIDKIAYRRSIGASPNDILLLSVGQISVRKNHRVIVEALAEMDDKDRYLFVVCGSATDERIKHELEELAESKNVRLKLLGFRRDIPQITACSDIGAIPSIREGLGLAGVQSLAAGIPVIGSDVQGIRDYVIEGKTGFLCRYNDASAFAENIRRILALSEEEMEAMRIECKNTAKKFDACVAVKEMEEIYLKILCENKRN